MRIGDFASLALLRKQNRRRTRLVSQLRRVHGYGPRPTFELVIDLATRAGAIELLEHIAELYAKLDPDLLRAIGAHDFPARPIRVVEGER